MAEPQPEPHPEPAAHRSDDQVAAERAMGHVSEVLTNLDWTIEKAKRGLKELRKSGDGTHRAAELALADAVDALERARKRLFQDAYYGGDRLL